MRLTPEREKEIIKQWLIVTGHSHESGTVACQEFAVEHFNELLEEISALRYELDSERRFSANIAYDVLSALSQFVATPDKGYLKDPCLIPMDIERLGKERDQLKSENNNIKEILIQLGMIATVLTLDPGINPDLRDKLKYWEKRTRQVLDKDYID